MKKIVFILLLGFFIFTPEVSWAQSLIAQNSPIVEKKSLADEILEVRRTYKGQLAEYRRAESESVITKGQFEQLNTLASLELAVQDMREVMLLRNQVLITYLKLMELELLEADGINLKEKNIALTNLEKLQKNFAEHQKFVEQAVDREKIAFAADDFEILALDITKLSEYVTDLLQVGRLQTIYDQLVTLVAEIDPKKSSTELSLKLNEKIRAHNEVGKVMAQVNENLQFVWSNIEESRLTGLQTKVSKENSSIYAGLSQILIFLEEILK